MRDLTHEILEHIHSELRIDEEWTLRGERNFSWTAYRLGQLFIVSPPVIDKDTYLFPVHSLTPVVMQVSANDQHVEATLSGLNRLAVGHALVWDAENRLVLCHTGAPVHEETLSWRPAQIAHYAILAMRACEDLAEGLAEVLQGHVATWEHPISGARSIPDEMLWIGQNVFVPEGLKPSRFENLEDMQAIFKELENTPFFSAGADASGLSIEVPGGDDTMLIQLQTSPRHPSLGSGLLSTLKIRVPESDGSALGLATVLNTLESEGDLLSVNFGAWCIDEAGGQIVLAHARFTPNVLYRPKLSLDVAYSSLNRALWAGEILLGKHPLGGRHAADIALERMVRADASDC